MIVYHYCSLESLNSILKNRSLRLTNILKSNDSMEISWICRYYDAEFKRAYENASDLFRSKISSERLMGYVKLFTDEFFNENHADFRYYVTCFSYQNDLLSQWRGYADDGRGAAIGFDLDVLKEVVTVSPEISKPSIVSLHKISYSETEQREVELSLGARLYNYSYYVKESQLISYVDFDFSDCLDRLIKELVIGPKCLMSERDMEYYLTTLGLSNCRVKKSQGTYR